ncbi:MAG: riboflavin kinase, partial [Planctomycetota bacterium]
VEVHILDWKGTIYGERLEVTLLERIREVRKFDSIESLTQQLQQDIQACRDSFSAAQSKG